MTGKASYIFVVGATHKLLPHLSMRSLYLFIDIRRVLPWYLCDSLPVALHLLNDGCMPSLFRHAIFQISALLFRTLPQTLFISP